jgi:hypothetical protein
MQLHGKVLFMHCSCYSDTRGVIVMIIVVQRRWLELHSILVAVCRWCLLAFLSHRIIYKRTEANYSLHPRVFQGIESIGKQ